MLNGPKKVQGDTWATDEGQRYWGEIPHRKRHAVSTGATRYGDKGKRQGWGKILIKTQKKTLFLKMLNLRIQPYLQQLKWSIYFNSPVHSRLILLDEVVLNVAGSTTVNEILHLIWGKSERTQTIPNFEGKNKRLFLNGTELELSSQLKQSCLNHSELLLTATKVQLITEGLKKNKIKIY
jgi:hypothetical protein